MSLSLPILYAALGIAMNCFEGMAEPSSGVSIHHERSLLFMNEHSIREVEEQVIRLLRQGRLPQDDFEYYVDRNGRVSLNLEIKLIDLRAVSNRHREVNELAHWLDPETSVDFLFSEDVRGTPLPDSLRDQAEQAAQRIWQEFNRLYRQSEPSL